jgi:predicted PurR-regulated permease PerM
LIGVRVGGILGLLIAVPMAGFIKSAAEVLYKRPMESKN